MGSPPEQPVLYPHDQPFGDPLLKKPSGDSHRVGESGRQDGPSQIYPDGTEIWHINGRWHRLDGPARIFPDGYRYWTVGGKEVTEEEYRADPRTMLKPLPEGSQQP